MGEKKLFSNKKKNTNNNKKKIQLCTAFGYNCFSIKSLLFWKEPFLTSAGGMGQRRRVPSRTRFGTAAGTGPLFSGWRCRVKPFSSPLPFPPVPLSTPNGFAPSRADGRTDRRTEPGAQRHRRGRGAAGTASTGRPRR